MPGLAGSHAGFLGVVMDTRFHDDRLLRPWRGG